MLRGAGKVIKDHVLNKPIRPNRNILRSAHKHHKSFMRGTNLIGGTAVIAGAVVAGNLVGGAEEPTSTQNMKMIDTIKMVNREIGGLPPEIAEPSNMMADGVSNTPTPSQAPTLGTNGSMVFGMNNMKQGGYL